MPRFKIRTRSLTAGAWCAPCVAEEFQAQTAELTRSQFGPSGLAIPEVEIAPAPAEDMTVARWSGVIAVEGLMTGDGRLIEAGALRWDGVLPLPLRWDREDDGAHLGAVVVGLIETVERRGGEIFATGFVDLVSDNGWDAAQLMDKKMLRGVSIDPDEFDYEIRVKAELLTAGVPDDDTGELEDDEAVAEVEIPEADAAGYVTIGRSNFDDEIMVAVNAELRGATLVDIAAFKGASIALDVPLGARPALTEAALVASAARLALVAAIPVNPPAKWFRDPGLAGPTALTITDDGRVYGHLANWDSCHIGFDSCVAPPRSATGYAWFRTGLLVADDGSEHPVGQITMATGHASTAASAMAAASHYDNTGAAVADVTAGEDAFGIWVAGALRPGVTDAQKRELRASPLSGDWRRVGSNLELVAALAVSVPGFNIKRGMVASGRQESLQLPAPTTDALVAAGFHPSEPDTLDVEDSMEFTASDMRELRVLLASSRREQAARADEAAEMARSLAAEELAREMGI